jgi:hypothetical protein
MILRRKSDRADRREGEASPGQGSVDPNMRTELPSNTAGSLPVAGASWDPYEVWLTRVKQPRDRIAKRAARSVPPAAQVDTSDTARLRILSSPAPSR